MNPRDHRASPGELPANPGPGNPDALYETGLQLMQAGQYLDAQICCERVLAIDASHPDTLHLMGLLSHRAGQYDLAVAWITRAIQNDPKPQYLGNLGTVLLRQERHEEALKVFDKAVQLQPGDAELWKNLGNTLIRLDRPDDALLTFQHVLKLNPRHRDAAYAIGRFLYNQKRFEEALQHFDLCDEIQPGHALTLQMRAVSLLGLKRREEGLVIAKRAHALDPQSAEVCDLIGMLLAQLGRDEEALPWYERSLELRPGAADTINNRAFSLSHQHRFTECLELYDSIRAIDPDNMRAVFQASLVHLLTGNFEAGWAEREARWAITGMPIDRFGLSQPAWLGREPLDGKTIFVFEDEGVGDTIQFSRYVPLLAARGAHVILSVTDAVRPLLADMPGVSQCVSRTVKPLPDFDLHCPITSLPFAFETRLDTIPSGLGYLPQPDEARQHVWEARLSEHLAKESKLRVGLVWSGNPVHVNDHNRSIPLRMLSSLLGADACFVSLQKNPKPEDAAILERSGIVDLTAHLTDFAETAALVSRLDLVITVDTSVAHLAAALGRPTWILLPYLPDWRWLLDRNDSPWYPTARLFRQDKTRDYTSVVARARDELDVLISGFIR